MTRKVCTMLIFFVFIAGIVYSHTPLKTFLDFNQETQIWIDITLIDNENQMQLNATSALQSADNVLKGKYGAAKLFDQDFTTAWVEGTEGAGVQESVLFILPEGRTRLNIMNGYTKSKSLYKKNNRPKKLKLTLYAGVNPEGYVSEIAAVYKSLPYPEEYIIDLSDTCSVQSFAVPVSWKEINKFKKETIDSYTNDFDIPPADTSVIIKLEINEVYTGSRWDDTCISELFFNDVYIHNPLEEKYTQIDSVYVNDQNNTILIDYVQYKGMDLYTDPESILQIIDTSPDNQWVILIRMSAAPSPRHQTEYLLLNTFLGQVMNSAVRQTSGDSVTGPLLFKFKGKNLFLEYYTPGSEQSKQMLLK